MIIYNGNIQVSSTKPISNFLFFLSSYTFTSYTHTHTHNHHQTPNQIFTKLNHDRYTITIRFTFSLTLYTHTYTQKKPTNSIQLKMKFIHFLKSAKRIQFPVAIFCHRVGKKQQHKPTIMMMIKTEEKKITTNQPTTTTIHTHTYSQNFNQIAMQMYNKITKRVGGTFVWKPEKNYMCTYVVYVVYHLPSKSSYLLFFFLSLFLVVHGSNTKQNELK